MIDILRENVSLITFGSATVTALGGFFGGRAVTQYRIAGLTREVESIRSELNTVKSDMAEAHKLLASISTDLKWLIKESK